MMTYEKVMKEMVNACAEAGKKIAQQNAMMGGIRPLYLYYKKSTKTVNGELILVADNVKEPTGFELGAAEGLRGDVPYENYFNWVQARSTRLPVLASA